MRLARLAVLALLPAGPAMSAPAECSLLDSPAERLACFDREFPRAASLQQEGDGWETWTRKSPFTDVTDRFVSVRSREPVSCRWNDGEPVRMTVQCVNDATSLVFETGCYMTSSRFRNYGEVLMRTDEDEAMVVPMEASPDHTSLGLWGGEKSIPLIRQMIGKSTLTARMAPYSERPFVAEFDISGMGEAIADLRAECKW
jgi:hypothetical protein